MDIIGYFALALTLGFGLALLEHWLKGRKYDRIHRKALADLARKHELAALDSSPDTRDAWHDPYRPLGYVGVYKGNGSRRADESGSGPSALDTLITAELFNSCIGESVPDSTGTSMVDAGSAASAASAASFSDSGGFGGGDSGGGGASGDF